MIYKVLSYVTATDSKGQILKAQLEIGVEDDKGQSTSLLHTLTDVERGALNADPASLSDLCLTLAAYTLELYAKQYPPPVPPVEAASVEVEKIALDSQAVADHAAQLGLKVPA